MTQWLRRQDSVSHFLPSHSDFTSDEIEYVS